MHRATPFGSSAGSAAAAPLTTASNSWADELGDIDAKGQALPSVCAHREHKLGRRAECSAAHAEETTLLVRNPQRLNLGAEKVDVRQGHVVHHVLSPRRGAVGPSRS
jgi:hypothetical protein